MTEMLTDSDLCTCAHVYDEHDDQGDCTVEGCDCFYFEAAEEDEE